MRPSLRRTLTGLVLAASPGCLFDQPCYEEHTVTAHVDEPPPTDLAFMLDQCDADPTMCFPVCTKILADKQPFQSVSKCSVVKTGSGHDVEISYDVSTGASGCPIAGRRPAGLRRYRSQARDAVGAYLARAAHFEAASVYAFVGLAHELAREVATWVDTKLSAAARRRVLAAQKRAVATLARGVAKEAPVALRAIGMPAPDQMRRLFRDARAQLWS